MIWKQGLTVPGQAFLQSALLPALLWHFNVLTIWEGSLLLWWIGEIWASDVFCSLPKAALQERHRSWILSHIHWIWEQTASFPQHPGLLQGHSSSEPSESHRLVGQHWIWSMLKELRGTKPVPSITLLPARGDSHAILHDLRRRWGTPVPFVTLVVTSSHDVMIWGWKTVTPASQPKNLCLKTFVLIQK